MDTEDLSFKYGAFEPFEYGNDVSTQTDPMVCWECFEHTFHQVLIKRIVINESASNSNEDDEHDDSKIDENYESNYHPERESDIDYDSEGPVDYDEDSVTATDEDLYSSRCGQKRKFSMNDESMENDSPIITDESLIRGIMNHAKIVQAQLAGRPQKDEKKWLTRRKKKFIESYCFTNDLGINATIAKIICSFDDVYAAIRAFLVMFWGPETLETAILVDDLSNYSLFKRMCLDILDSNDFYDEAIAEINRRLKEAKNRRFPPTQQLICE